MTKPCITVVGLSLALQRTLEFDAFQPGGVNRARAVTQTASGKGANVARVLKTLGDHPLLIAFNGGETGRFIEQDLTDAGISCRLIPTAAPTRICQTLLDGDSGRVTELVEESAPPSEEEWKVFQSVFENALTETRFLIITGTLIPGAPPDLYARLAGMAEARDIPWIIDSQQAPLMASLVHKPELAKLNEEELAATGGANDDVIAAGKSLLEAGAQNVLVTCGAEGAWHISRNGATRLETPVVRAVNPIGSGDAVTAGVAHALHRGDSVESAIRLGMACGAANAATKWPGFLDWSAATRKPS